MLHFLGSNSSWISDSSCCDSLEVCREHWAFSQQVRVDFNTVNPSLPRMDSLIHPWRFIDDEENVHCPFSTKNWKIHPLQPWAWPLRLSGNLLGVGDWFTNTSLVLVEHGYNPRHLHCYCRHAICMLHTLRLSDSSYRALSFGIVPWSIFWSGKCKETKSSSS